MFHILMIRSKTLCGTPRSLSVRRLQKAAHRSCNSKIPYNFLRRRKHSPSPYKGQSATAAIVRIVFYSYLYNPLTVIQWVIFPPDNARTLPDEWSARRTERYPHNTHPRPLWDSYPQSQHSSGRIHSPQTARPPGPAVRTIQNVDTLCRQTAGGTHSYHWSLNNNETSLYSIHRTQF
jgi:hypothetical protein